MTALEIVCKIEFVLPYNLNHHPGSGETIMPQPRKLTVFLCCSPEDKPIVRELYDRLEAEGWIEPWLDEEKLVPGMNWDTEVEKAVACADTVIVCISNSAFAGNQYVQREMRFVLNLALENTSRSVFIIPLRLDNCQMPRHVQTWQFYDFSVLDQREEVYQRLRKSLQIRANVDPNIRTPGPSAHFVSGSHVQDGFIPSTDIVRELDFIEIHRGKFLMGSKVLNSRALDDEYPQHPCYISYDYGISRFPVTNAQFGEFAISNKRRDLLVPDWKLKLKQPATNVSWHHAMTYVTWLNKVFGKELDHGLVFRLPTEAEWERAARGDHGREWPWGDESLDQMIDRELFYIYNRPADEPGSDDFRGSSEISDFYDKVFHSQKPSDAHERWRSKSGIDYAELRRKVDEFRKRTDLVDVGTFSPLTDSPYKVADMMGNIIEWTQSLYMPYPYDAGDGRENIGDDGKRVLRGLFASGNERFSVRCARRWRAQPHEKDRLLGFRIVIAPAA